MCTCLISAKAIRRVPSLIPGTGAVAANSERKTFHFLEGFSFFIILYLFIDKGSYAEWHQQILKWYLCCDFPGLLHILLFTEYVQMNLDTVITFFSAYKHCAKNLFLKS